MTNREYLNSIYEKYVDWLIDEYEKLKFNFSHTRIGLIEWLIKQKKRSKSMKNKSLCVGDRVVLVKALNDKLNVTGFVYEIGAINEDFYIIRQCNTGLAVSSVNVKDFDTYFVKLQPQTKWSEWAALLGEDGSSIIGVFRTNRKKVQVKINNTIGEASCNYNAGDTFNLAFGVQLALLRAKKKYKTKILKSLEDYDEQIKNLLK